MSKSRSATPKPNITHSVNISPSTESTTSRLSIHENTPSGHYFAGREQQLASHNIPHSFHRPPPEASSHASSSHLRPPELSSDQPMSKRRRRESSQRRQSSASPSSDSQDGMADTETDTSRHQPSEPPQLLVNPQPKKKRTRTLTTPHQSAVLHALLAQSRFPTTAMREEVGRSIGLSARKVQIWFQNQRQKARRPRSQSDASRPPPQYGPFPPGADPSVLSSLSTNTEQGTSTGITQLGHARTIGFEEGLGGPRPSASFTGPLNSPSQLSGPGVPGTDYRPHHERPSTASLSIHRPDPSSSGSRPYTNPGLRTISSSTPYPRSNPRPITTGRLHDREFSRTLPPLNFESLQSRGGLATGHHRIQAPPALHAPPYPFSRPSTPETSFAHHPPEPYSRASMALPPPFTLQPTPQWGTSLSAPIRLEALAGSHLSPLPGNRSFVAFPASTDTRDTDSEITRVSHMDTTPPVRSGRYDPVRATFIRTTSTSPPPSLAQETGGGSDGGGSGNGDSLKRS